MAQYMAGYFLYHGIGVNKDPQEALKWLGKAKDKVSYAKDLINDGYYADGTVKE